MRNDPLYAEVLSVKLISNVNNELKDSLELGDKHNSIGIITCDIDDVGYTGLDHATKNAAIDVVYAKSFYGGADNATQKLAGEFIGIIAASSPSEVKSGLNSAVNFIENNACFYSANEDDSICYYNHCISRTGSYLSETAGIKKGDALAYLIAPPAESIYALDAALKAADVTITNFFGPPSETNFGGAMLTGNQSACKAACSAFAYAVKEVADNPKRF